MAKESTATIEIRRGDPEDLSAWEEGRRGSLQSAPFNSATLLRAIHRHLMPLEILEVWRGGRMIGGCFGTVRKDGKIRHFVSPVTLGHAQLWIADKDLAPSPAATLARVVIDALIEDLAARHDHIEMLVDPRFPDAYGFLRGDWRVDPYRTYQLPLTDSDSLFRGLEASTRNHIKRAKKKGLVTEATDDIDGLAGVLADMAGRRGLGTPDLKPFLAEMVGGFLASKRGRLFETRRSTGEVAAALFMTWDGDYNSIYVAAHSNEHGRDAANTLNYWEAIEWSAQNRPGGVLDLYGTDPEEVGQFKKQFNAPLAHGFRIKHVANPALHWRSHLRETVRGFKRSLKGRRM